MTDEAVKPGKQKGRHKEKRLSALAVKTAARGKHPDGNGLYLVVEKTGSRRWEQRLMVRGKRRDIGLGSASLVPLGAAREAAEANRRLARAGGDPLAEKRRAGGIPTFEEAAKACHAAMKDGWRNAKHRDQWLSSLTAYAFPNIGDMRVDRIETSDVARCLTPIWLSKPETSRRVRQRIASVLDYSKAHGHRDGENPVAGVGKALPSQKGLKDHHAAMPYADVPDFMARLRQADDPVSMALRLLILTAARSGEIRGARIGEFDLGKQLWSVPAERMKGGRLHEVPLSDAAVAVVRRALELRTGRSDMLFEGRNGAAMSDMTLGMRVRRMGATATVHGFRSSFRDWTAEQTSTPHDVAEMALAHAVGNKVELAYKRTALLERRRLLMRQWAGFVVPDADAGVVVFTADRPAA